MKLTYYGHACFSVESNGTMFLFDPFITPNPKAQHINADTIKADYIFISHAHGDHIADAVSIAKRTQAMCVGAFEVTGWLQKHGIEKTHGMNHGGLISFDFGKVRGVNAIHSSSFPDGTYGGNPMGFVFTINGSSFYYSGDTALTMDMKLIPQWVKLDFAIFPIGSNFTMDVADAIKAADFVECTRIVGIHYDTFAPIEIDNAKAVADFKAAGKTLLLPEIGETIEV